MGIAPPEIRMGDSLRIWGRPLSVFQKEALAASSRTSRDWPRTRVRIWTTTTPPRARWRF